MENASLCISQECDLCVVPRIFLCYLSSLTTKEALEMEIPGVGGRAVGQHFAPGVHSERVGRLSET